MLIQALEAQLNFNKSRICTMHAYSKYDKSLKYQFIGNDAQDI